MMSLSGISELEKYAQHFSPTLPKTPAGRFASVIVLRETKSYAIFTTEGGEQQDIEQTQAGLANRERIDRLVMFKRKQVAPERRTGKALLRQYGVFPYATLTENDRVLRVVYGAEDIAKTQEEGKSRRGAKIDPHEDCYLIAGMCAHCVDCLTYGFAAVEGQGARKARVLTDSCFSVRPYPLITEKKKFNYIDEHTHTSGTITEFDHTKPHTFFPSVVTTVDLTLDEFVYVLNNLLRTSRYGKEVAHLGLMANHILAIALSDVELFSNLEFSQAFYDAFKEAATQESTRIRMEFGLSLPDFLDHEKQVISDLVANLNGRCMLIQGDDLKALLEQARALNQDQDRLTTFLKELNRQAASFTV
jgi:CRISPR-associated protein Csc2